ncbi:intraflagellar transport protein Oseg5 isoform X1 [Leptinotarsa decemlineata]|uniref:intraflagellar transport protein Oseg5 isoform X1 n=2 Tax=Leptinotarsa decemlineata TaxID=7539 RepID=UPI003D30C11E
MRFKISLADKPSHRAPVTCVGWSSTEEVYSAGDDSQLLSWSVSTNQSTKITQFNAELCPTDMQFLPRVSGTLGKHGDLILITSVDGKFHIMNRAGKIERSVEAHKGAILVGQWGNDGTGLLTAGEDGLIKIWSRSGMLRSTVVSSESSVYGASWSPDSQAIAYTQGKCLVVKQLAPNTKPLRWKAHEALVLCLAWSAASDLIVSGGEDCKYRVWDNQGRQMFSSSLHGNHITSISWSPAGDIFAIGSFNTLRLCDYSGWSRSLEKPNTGCIYKMAWSADGTQLAGACANGQVLFAHVVERDVQFMNFTAVVSEKKIVTVQNVLDETNEHLELPERVIQMALRYNHLVLTTPSQCYIYNTRNWNTPAIFDLKDGSVILLLLCEEHMLLVEKSSVGIYNYQGRLIASPRWPSMRLDYLRNSHVTLSPDTLAIRDTSDVKTIHIIDISNNRSSAETTAIQHSMQIVQISLDQWGEASGRKLAILDKTRDMYLIHARNNNKMFLKLGRKIESFQWNANENIIAAIQDTQLIVWYCPTACYNVKLLKLCSMQYDSPELGRTPRIHDFVGNSVSVRRADGSLLNIPISPFPTLIHRYVRENKWTDALNLCRTTNDETAWACLAVLATQSNSETIDVAEEAYANINHHEKVFFLQHIKSLSSKAEQKSQLALLGGKTREAESILLHNGMVFQAIYMNITSHNWTRALDMAVKHKTHIDTVLYLRQKYLEGLGKSENNNKFSSLNETVQIDSERVEQKLALEMQKRKTSN